MAMALRVNRATIHRILAGIHEEIGLIKRRRGHVVEYRLMTLSSSFPRERAR